MNWENLKKLDSFNKEYNFSPIDYYIMEAVKRFFRKRENKNYDRTITEQIITDYWRDTLL